MNNMLIISCLALLVGPVLYQLFSGNRSALQVIDGFVFVSIGGLLFIHLSHSFHEEGSLWVLVFLLVGFIGPLFIEKAFARIREEVHLLTLFAGVIGFLAHVFVEGAALIGSEGEEAQLTLLTAAVILHRVPVGLALWWLFFPRYGVIVAASAIGLTIACTLAGYFLASSLVLEQLTHTFSWVQAFVAGSILHVVFFRFHLHADGEEDGEHDHHDHGHTHHHEDEPQKVTLSSFEGFGNLLGLALLMLFIFFPGHEHNLSIEEASIAQTFIELCIETAPALFIAYFLGIFIYGFFPEGSIQWLTGGGRVFQSAKGMFVGLPLPVCSCGVLPYYQTLVKKGAPPAAAVAFLIATPELGIDAILISLPLLGAELTIARLVASALIAFIVSYLISLVMTPKNSLPVLPGEGPKTMSDKLKRGVRFALVDLVDTTAPWMLLGILLGAIATPMVEMSDFQLSGGLEVLLFSCLGLVIYVCASGATPLVAALVAGGVSPGAGLAFLITGPATNISTFGVLSELHNRKVAFLFALFMIIAAITAGYVTNMVFPNFEPVWSAGAHHEHHHDIALWQWISLAGVVLLFLSSLLRQGGRRFFGHVFTG